VNVDCDKCAAHTVAKLTVCSDAVAFSYSPATGQLQFTGSSCSGPGMCLDGGEGPAEPPCEPGEFYMPQGQAQLLACGAQGTGVWKVVLLPVGRV
jgi:hypothetical protein